MVDYVLEKKKEEVRNLALKKLSYKIRTEKEIRDFLNDNKCEYSLIEDTISFLKEYKYIDDVFYSKAYFKDAKLRKKGKIKIINELKLKGIKESDILEGIDIAINEEGSEIKDELSYAKDIVSKMIKDQLDLGKAIDEKFKAKVLRRLISKGYSNDVSFKALKEIK